MGLRQVIKGWRRRNSTEEEEERDEQQIGEDEVGYEEKTEQERDSKVTCLQWQLWYWAVSNFSSRF